MSALVLVHGASHSRRCWEPTVAELARQAPAVPVLAVDLPGRGGVPADLGTVRVADWVASVVEQVRDAGLDDVVLVGHSMAGLTVPGVAAELGPAVVKRLVLIAACIPPQGGTVLDTLAPPLRAAIRRQVRRGGAAKPLARPLARLLFCNGMTAAQRRVTLDQLCDDASGIALEPIDRSGLPGIPRTWVLTKRDRALPPARQRRFIANLGGVQELVEVDSCHDVMIARPAELAALLARLATGPATSR